jgi:1-acyl-sn-glycerol-3-phosphate acyltransferase
VNTPIVIRSALYFVWFAAVSLVTHLAALPLLLLPRRAMLVAAQCWSGLLIWGLGPLAGLKLEVRGDIPSGAVLVACKHMSMWDTLAMLYILPDPAIVLKRELLKIPFYGWYARKAAMISVDRSAGASALRKMTEAAKKALADGREIVIFPEGTRKSPGAEPDYKPGVAALYAQLQVPCVPVALNSGLFWTGFKKNEGRIVVEFLPPIPAGLKRVAFMAKLENDIEAATARLVTEGRDQLERRNRA